MPVEIEHKYLVDKAKWQEVQADNSVEMTQAYMVSEANKTIRVRTADKLAFLTIKGKTQGASRAEFEYEIPVNEANELIEQFCTKTVKKRRFYVAFKGKTWEIDVFSDKNEGLIVAEVELDSEMERYEKPDWVTIEVTSDFKYTNSQLAKHPFCDWK